MTDAEYLREMARTTPPQAADHIKRLELIADRLAVMEESDRVMRDAYFINRIELLRNRIDRLEAKTVHIPDPKDRQ